MIKRTKTILLLIVITVLILLTTYLRNNFSKEQNIIYISDTDFTLNSLCFSGRSQKFQDLPPAKLLSGIGNSNWVISTQSDSTQIYFNQGINALHAFWDVEAFRAFKKALTFDPNCAMAHWGLSRSITQTVAELKELKKKSLLRAITYLDDVKDYEREFILAYKAYSKKGRSAYKDAMEKYIKKYPNQENPKLFYASFLSSGVNTYLPNGVPTKENLRGQKLLKEVMETHPYSSALHHYWIHAVENSTQPEQALESAKIISKLAPNCGHMTHMPGHIYYRTGNYTMANKAFYNSLKVDSTYMVSSQIGSINNWNYIHNLDYLVSSCAESGRYNEGLKWAKRISKVAINKARRMSRGSGYILFGAYTSIPRFHLRYEEWDKATKSLDTLIKKIPWNNSKAVEYFQGVSQYAKGMSFLNKGDINRAKIKLKTLRKTINNLKNNSSRISADWYFRYAIKILQVNAQELEGLILYKSGKKKSAIALLKKACKAEKEIGYWEPPHYSRPVSESLARLYENEENWSKAIETYELTLQIRPKNGHSQFGLAKVMEQSSKTPAKVIMEYKKFLKYWQFADNHDEKLTHAKKYLSTIK